MLSCARACASLDWRRCSTSCPTTCASVTRETGAGGTCSKTASDRAMLFEWFARMKMPRLLERQHYRLAHWREAATAINYRRFFDINSLAGVRVEQPAVFADTQRLPIELVERGDVDGLRID